MTKQSWFLLFSPSEVCAQARLQCGNSSVKPSTSSQVSHTLILHPPPPHPSLAAQIHESVIRFHVKIWDVWCFYPIFPLPLLHYIHTSVRSFQGVMGCWQFLKTAFYRKSVPTLHPHVLRWKCTVRFHFHTQILLMLLPLTAHRKCKPPHRHRHFCPFLSPMKGTLIFYCFHIVALEDWVWTSPNRFFFLFFLVINCEVYVKRKGY